MISAALLAIINFAFLILVLWFIAYLIEKYILPALPKTWVKYLGAVIAAIIIIILLEQFFGLHL